MRIRKLTLTLAMVLALIFITVSVFAAKSYGYRKDEIIVRFKSDSTAHQTAFNHGMTVKKSILELGLHCLAVPKGVTAEEAIAKLEKDPNVAYAGPNHLIKMEYIPNDTYFLDYQYGLYNTNGRHDIHAPEAWDLGKGSPKLVIAIVDSGIDSTHPDLAGRVIAGYNAIDGSTNTMDDLFHGTFVASLACANTDNNEGIAGVDWYAKLMPVKVIDSTGYGDEFNAATGITWAADHGAKIINMSFGSYDDGTNTAGLAAMEIACNYAWKQGCVLVAAAGNDRIDDAVQKHYPSYYPVCISVGGTDENDDPWETITIDPNTFEIITIGTNYGDSLKVMASASSLIGAVPLWYTDQIGTTLGDAYEVADGTSGSAPVVSGIASLLWASHPKWTNQQIVDEIEHTCDDLGDPGWDRDTGWGRVNAYRALSEAVDVYPNINSLYNAGSGSMVSVQGKQVTAGSTDFGDRFFIEEGNRTSGMMVYWGSTVTTATSQYDNVTVSGKLDYVDGQLAITHPRVTKNSTATNPMPLWMPTRNVGGIFTTTSGIGTQNTGMLVTVIGKVTAKSWNYFYIDDGSNLSDGSGFTGLKIFCGSLNRPNVGSLVQVTGVSTAEVPQSTTLHIPVVRPRTQSDIVIK